MAAAALLVWAVRLVRTGVERAFSVPLRRVLRRTEKSRLQAVATGAAAAIALQSATAVAILITGFTAAGTLTAATGLAVLLGADIGSAIVTQLLMAQPAWLMPLLLVIGVVLFLRGERKTVRQSGRILIGLALIFVALGMIREATGPLRDSAGLLRAMGYIGQDSIIAFAIAAVFTWAIHSSVAAVLLIVTFAAHGVMPLDTAAAMVLGANLGGSYIAVPLTMGTPPNARLVVFANVALRGGGALLILFLMPLFLEYLGATPDRQVINLHLAFNVAVALISLPLIPLVLRLMQPLAPSPKQESTHLIRPSALDSAALRRPDDALTCATREILRLGQQVEAILREVMPLYLTWDAGKARAIRDMADSASRMNMDIKLYLAKLGSEGDSEDTASRAAELSSISAHLDAAGDRVGDRLVSLAKRLNDEGLVFSAEGLEELCDFHDRVLSNAQTSLNILVTDNPDAARGLVEEKEQVRAHEERLQRAHIDRLRQNTQASIDTSNIHQEVLRELKGINTAFTMIAYPILADSGDLLRSRLRKKKKGKE